MQYHKAQQPGGPLPGVPRPEALDDEVTRARRRERVKRAAARVEHLGRVTANLDKEDAA